MDPKGTFMFKSLITLVSAENVLNAFKIHTADFDPVETSSVFIGAIFNSQKSYYF